LAISAKEWLALVHALPLPDRVRIMNVCGGHERAITMAGLRTLLPDNIELIPGPGCPVCVTPEEDIYQAIQLARNEQLTLLTFGDMLRVPVNLPRDEIRTLEQARGAGGDIRPVASPTDVLRCAQQNPHRQVVFFATGFETTAAPVASMLVEGAPDNLSLLLTGRRTWPAVAMLLQSESPGFDALVAPGHVAAVMGPEEWEFVVERHRLPAAVAGFTPESLLAAFYSVLRQISEDRQFLDNCYPQVVHPGGNPTAQSHLDSAFEVTDSNWRGIGVIPASGFTLREEYRAQDARRLYPNHADAKRNHIGEMPPGCDCARVVLGKIYPDQCALYGGTCTPRDPVGPCMVSDEGACRIWWASGKRERGKTITP
jgi:hydrogenase expression/formation protein HypD